MTTQAQTIPFSVPMANMNLPPSEALNQIMDNLNHLNVIVNQAINTIHFRIKQESQLLKSISNRVADAYKKTQLIAQNPNKSTTIYSKSNYPFNYNINNDNKPIINKTSISASAKPKRSKYNLSLNQRDQKPNHNINTIKLYKSINNKTNNIIQKQNNKLNIDSVTSVSDILIFGTNNNAYSNTKNNQFIHRKRRKKKDQISLNKHAKNSLNAAAPPSINGSNNYYLKKQHKLYGNAIKYRPEIDRNNMPKFQIHSNIFNENIAADISYNNNNNSLFIPSDVINKRDRNIEFEDNYHKYPTPTDVPKDAPDDVPNDVPQHVANNVAKDVQMQQPVISDDNSQNKSLQINQEQKQIMNDKVKVVNNSLLAFDVNALQKQKKELKKGKNNPKKMNKIKENQNIARRNDNNRILPFNAEALQKRKEKLKHHKNDKNNDIKKEKERFKSAMQLALEERLKNLRKNVGTSDEEDSEMSDID